MMFPRYNLYRLKKASAPDKEYKAALRARLLASQQVVYVSPRRPIFRYAFATAALALVLFFSLGSYAYASSAVTDGSVLYPVKTGIEGIEAGFQRTPEQQARFQAKLMNRRMKEVAYKVRHKKTPPPGLMRNVLRQLDLTIEDVRALKGDQAGQQELKATMKGEVEHALLVMRETIEQSDFSDEEKQRHLRSLDTRLEKLRRIKGTSN